MTKLNIELGQRGERIAINFLKNNGYDIIRTNYRNKLGEIDIIAKDKKTICFVEVKGRWNQRLGQAAEAVDLTKQRKISQVALWFLKQNRLLDSSARFDVISISHPECSDSLRITPGCRSQTSKRNYIRHFYSQPKVKLIKNAFQLDQSYLY